MFSLDDAGRGDDRDPVVRGQAEIPAQGLERLPAGVADADGPAVSPGGAEQLHEPLSDPSVARVAVEEHPADGGRHAHPAGRIEGDAVPGRQAVDEIEVPLLEDGQDLGHQDGVVGRPRSLVVVHPAAAGDLVEAGGDPGPDLVGRHPAPDPAGGVLFRHEGFERKMEHDLDAAARGEERGFARLGGIGKDGRRHGPAEGAERPGDVEVVAEVVHDHGGQGLRARPAGAGSAFGPTDGRLAGRRRSFRGRAGRGPERNVAAGGAVGEEDDSPTRTRKRTKRRDAASVFLMDQRQRPGGGASVFSR